MAVKYFEDLEAWKSARTLTREIYDFTGRPSFSKDFGLRDQITRASVSIMSNIAEGFERGGTQEFIQFLSIAKGSCGGVRCQLYVAFDQEYLDKQEGVKLMDECRRLSIMTKISWNTSSEQVIKGQSTGSPGKKHERRSGRIAEGLWQGRRTNRLNRLNGYSGLNASSSSPGLEKKS